MHLSVMVSYLRPLSNKPPFAAKRELPGGTALPLHSSNGLHCFVLYNFMVGAGGPGCLFMVAIWSFLNKLFS